jgi:hypothetical protein
MKKTPLHSYLIALAGACLFMPAFSLSSPLCFNYTLRMKKIAYLILSIIAICASGIRAEDEIARIIQAEEFDRLLKLIKPQPGESPWREIDWLTDVTEARKRSIAENKPLIIFTAADGSPLGRT